jgi:hypothetical protein
MHLSSSTLARALALVAVPGLLAAADLAPRPAYALAAPDARAICRAAGGIVVAESENALACNRLGVGAYEVIIGNNVNQRTYVATLGLIGAGAPAAGEIGVARGSANDRVRVQTRDSAGAAANRSSHLVVAC